MLGLALSLLAAPAAAQDWVARQGDGGHSGSSGAPGDITRPAAGWRISLGEEVPGASISVIDLDGDGVDENIALLGGALVARNFAGEILWDTPPLGLARLVDFADLNGDGRRELVYLGALNTIIDPLSGRVIWRTGPVGGTFYTGTNAIVVNADADPEPELLISSILDRNLVLWDFSENLEQPTQRWSLAGATGRPFPTNIFRPVVGDFDGDGQALEIASVNQSNCQIIFTDLRDGAVLQVTPGLTQGTSCLGTAIAVNLDTDPQDELLFTGQLATSTNSASITVFDYVDAAIQWQYEYAVNNSAANVQAPPHFIGDLDGDGAIEVALGIYGNGAEVIGSASDGVDDPDNWTTVLYDGATGATLGTLTNRLLTGVRDLSGDGNPELIVRTMLPNSNAIPETGDTEIYSLDALRGLTLVGRRVGAIPVSTALLRTPGLNVWSNNFIESVVDVDADGLPELLLAGDDGAGGASLELVQLSDAEALTLVASTPVEGGRFPLFVDEVTDGSSADTLLISSSTGIFGRYDASLVLQSRVPVAGATSWQVVTSLRPGERNLVIRDGRRDLVAYAIQDATALLPPVELWRRPLSSGEFIALDRDGDGTSEIAWLGVEADGVNFVELTDGEGVTLWRRRFPGLLANLKGLVAGRFGGSSDALDLAILTIEAADLRMTYTLDGEDGETIQGHRSARADVLQFGNREVLFAGDQNGDDLDELVIVHYATFEQLNGADLNRISAAQPFSSGSQAPSESALIPEASGELTFYTHPLVGSLQAHELNPQLERWSQPQPATTMSAATGFPGFADVNSDGTQDIAAPGLFGEVTVYDGTNGAVLYRVCLSEGAISTLDAPATSANCVPLAPVSNVVTADIDGDGDLEFILCGAGGWVYALNVEDGSPVWQADVGAQAFFPTIADVDGDGTVEIIVSTRLSEIVVLDQSNVDAVAEVRDVAVLNGQVSDAATDLDLTQARGTLGVAWDSAQGADRYLVRIFTSNGTTLVPTTDVGAATSRVFSNLSLVPGATYFAEVTALSNQLGTGPVTRSDGVRLLGLAPVLRSVSVSPNPFTRLVNSAVQMTVSATADGIILLQSVEVSVEAEADDAVVFSEVRTLTNRTTASVTFSWDGRLPGGEPASTGAYRVRFRATDADGTSSEQVQGLSIRDVGEPLITDLIATPNAFSPAAGQTTRITATVEADLLALITELTLTIEDEDGAVFRTWVTNPNAALAALDRTWDGTDEAGDLLPPGAYIAHLVAEDNRLGTSEAIAPLTVLVAEAPTVNLFTATPPAFTPADGETTTLSVDVTSASELTEVRITIIAPNDAVVFEDLQTPGAVAATFSAVWDGTDGQGLVPAGPYTALLEATNAAGLQSTATVELVVLEPGQGAVTIQDAAATPSTFDACQGERASITARITSAEGDLSSVTVIIRADDIIQRELTFRAALTDSYELSALWNGTNAAGAQVSPGVYTVEINAQAEDGSFAGETLEVTVRCGDDPNNNPGNNNPGNNNPGNNNPGNNDPDPSFPEGDVGGGCGCNTAGRSSSPPPMGVLLGLLALGGVVLLRRR